MEAYRAARQGGRYDASAYCMSNECEYWAEATQAWFDATVRQGEAGKALHAEAARLGRLEGRHLLSRACLYV